jgi:hypothetical protein
MKFATRIIFFGVLGMIMPAAYAEAARVRLPFPARPMLCSLSRRPEIKAITEKKVWMWS